MISELLTRLRFLIFRKRRRELDEEIEFHLKQAITTKIVAGMDPAEARRQALIEFGGIEPTREQCERQRPGWWIGQCRTSATRFADLAAIPLRTARRGEAFAAE